MLIGTPLTTVKTVGTNDFVVDLPSGNVGDLLVLFLASGGNNYGGLTAPDGWDLLRSENIGNNTSYIITRTTDGTDGSTVLVPWNVSVPKIAVAYRVRNHGTVEATSAAGLSTGTLTPLWGSANNLWLAQISAKRSDWTVTLPSGYADLTNVSTIVDSTEWSHGRMYTAHKEAIAALDAVTWSFTGEQDSVRSMLVAVQLTASAAPTHPFTSVTIS